MTATAAIPAASTRLDPAGRPSTVEPTANHLPTRPTSTAAEPTAMRLLTKAEVCERMRISERGLDKMIGRREFPSPVKLGKRHFWSHIPVDHWLSRKFAVQEAWRVT